MSDNYFRLLIETEKTAKSLNKMLKRYLTSNHVSCNIMQIIILHFLMKLGGGRTPQAIHNVMEIYTNNTYNFQLLVKNGYITPKNGKDIGRDNRCVFYDVTDKGKALYKDICTVASKKMKQIAEQLHWTEENFTDYFDDLEALQNFMGR